MGQQGTINKQLSWVYGQFEEDCYMMAVKCVRNTETGTI
jgi:hypothetical protein